MLLSIVVMYELKDIDCLYFEEIYVMDIKQKHCKDQ